MNQQVDPALARAGTTVIPTHMAVVPNGNRRRADRLNIPLEQSYIDGAMKALEMAGWAKEAGIKHFSLFGMSCENKANRKKGQIDALVHGANMFCDQLFDEDCNIHVFGKLEEFADIEEYKPLYERLRALQQREFNPEAFTIHVAANYSGMPQHELGYFMDALRHRGFAEVEKDPMKYLLSGGVPHIDLFFRSGGEHRISGFMPFQSSYAEIYVVNDYWGDIEEQHFFEALKWFSAQKRNFGK